MEVYPLKNQEADSIARIFVNEWVSRYGVPIELHSDQGANFESLIIQEMCKILNIKKTRTTPIHPQSDGMVERFIRTLVDFLKKSSSDQRDWEKLIPLFLLAYRTSKHSSTGFSPSEMIFGRNVSIPSDIIFGTKSELSRRTDFLFYLKESLDKIHEMARQNLHHNSERMKVNYDSTARGEALSEGDLVLLYNPQRKKGVCPKLEIRRGIMLLDGG